MSSDIDHSNIATFAEKTVNLLSEDARRYREQVNNLREELKKRIDADSDYNLIKMYHSGSVAKGTALKTLNDMDVAVYIKKPDEELLEDQMLEWLKERLQEVYPNMKPEQFIVPPGGHCVTLSFKGTGLDVDVSPVIYEGDEQDKGFLVTKDTGERVLTSIPMHLEFIRKRKAQCPIHYAQVIRLVKWWVREQKKVDPDFKFKSFMVEMINAHLLDRGSKMDDYIGALESFFRFIVQTELKECIYFTDYYAVSNLPEAKASPIEIFDPVNAENNITSKYTDEDRKNIVKISHSALDAIHEAMFATTKDRSLGCWKRVFGSSFEV